MRRPDPHKARSRPCGGGLGKNCDRPGQAIIVAEDSEALRHRQAERISGWFHISPAVAGVIADLHFRRAA